MAITTTEAFLIALRKSKLLSAEQIDTAREASAGVDNPKPLARLLLKQKLLTEWQARQLLAGRTAFFLGRYKLIDLLGRGGMGSVFSAEDTKMNRPVALKIISKQLGRDPAALERFFAEARAIAALDHPNIVRAYDVDNTSDRYFIVMEFAEGRNLQQVVENEGPLGYALSADYIRQAAEGLAHAHSRDIVHRDVKPANLVVNDRGVVKVLDMGMARLAASQASEEDGKDGGVPGTVDYLAPEQAMGDPDTDHRVDLYSLGCTLYFLLTGGPPFSEGTLAERIVKHQTEVPPPIGECRDDAPEELVAICEKLMAKEADARFASASEVAELLAEWQPPLEELQAAIPIVEPDEEDEAAETGKVAEPVFAAKSAGEGSGPLGIKIDTGGSSIIKKAPAAVRPSKDPSDTGTVARLLADRRIVIAAVVVGAILLVGLGVGLALLFSGGDQTDVADATSDDASQVGNASGSDAGGGAGKDKNAKLAKESIPETEMSAADLAGLEDLVGEKEKKEPDAAPKPMEEPAGETDKPKAPAEGDGGKPKDAPKPADKPAAAPSEPKKPETEKKPATSTTKKPEDPKPAEPKPKPKPLAALKEAAPILELVDKDEPGTASKAPLSLGTINAPDAADVQLLLLGGEDALKGDQKFTLSADTGSKASWLVQLDAAEAGGGRAVSPVAKISLAGKGLSFQWAAEAKSASASYLKNCILHVRLGGDNKYLQLGEPVIAEPIILDLAGGRINQTAVVKGLPDAKKLRIAILGIEGRTDFATQPTEAVPPKTPIGVMFKRKDSHGNLWPGVQFQVIPATKRSSVAFDVRLAVTPDIAMGFKKYEGLRYSTQQLLTLHDKMAGEKGKVVTKLSRAEPGEKEKLIKEIDGFDTQLWYLDFYTEIHKRGKLHYRIFVEVDGHEVVLATSTTTPINPVTPAK